MSTFTGIRRNSSFSAKKDEVKGWLRKTVQQIKVFQQTNFPFRYFVCDKIKKKLFILDKPGGNLKEEIEIGRIVKVDVVDASNLH